MLNPTSLLADALGRNLADTYRRIFGDREPHIAAALDEAARLVIVRIATSDCPLSRYPAHGCGHTLRSGHPTRAAPRADRISPGVGIHHSRGA